MPVKEILLKSHRHGPVEICTDDVDDRPREQMPNAFSLSFFTTTLPT